MTLNSFDRISQPFRDYLTSRASNYDYATARDLYADIPSELYGNEPAMMSFLRGNEDLGLEPREWMHVQSEANGGLDVPDNLVLGPRDMNRSIGADNMSDANLADVAEANQEAVDLLLEADPQVLLEAMPETFESTTTLMGVAANSNPPEVWVDAGRGARLEPVADVVADTTEAAEAGLGEMLGEALVEGLVPAMFAAKAGMAVADKCTTTEDKIGYGALASGGTVLLYVNPITGPLAWTATGIYSAVKLTQLACKAAPHIKRALA